MRYCVSGFLSLFTAYNLVLLCSSIEFLKDVCFGLMSGMHGFPVDTEEQAHQIKDHTEDVHTSLSAAASFQNLSSNDFCQGRERTDIAQINRFIWTT